MKCKAIIFLALFSLTSLLSSAQDSLPAEFHLPQNFSKPKLWLNADKARQKARVVVTNDTTEVKIIPGHRIYKKLYLQNHLDIIKRQSDFLTFAGSKEFMITHYDTAFPYLINHYRYNNTCFHRKQAAQLLSG